jgi:hypothetical protein
MAAKLSKTDKCCLAPEMLKLHILNWKSEEVPFRLPLPYHEYFVCVM